MRSTNLAISRSYVVNLSLSLSISISIWRYTTAMHTRCNDGHGHELDGIA